MWTLDGEWFFLLLLLLLLVVELHLNNDRLRQTAHLVSRKIKPCAGEDDCHATSYQGGAPPEGETV